MTDALKGLVIGIANEDSIAWACAKAFHDKGARLIVTCQNDQMRGAVEDLAAQIGAEQVLPLDVTDDGQMDAVLPPLPANGVGSISCSIPSPMPRRRTCWANW